MSVDLLDATGRPGARIADELREAILRGEYPPGARMRQEELADRHGASRVPVREALRILEADGLVTMVANTGRVDRRAEPGRVRGALPGPRAHRAAAAALQPAAARRRAIEQLASSPSRWRAAERRAVPALDREFHLGSYAGAETAVLGDDRAAAVEQHPALPPRVHPAARRDPTASCTTSTTCWSPRSAAGPRGRRTRAPRPHPAHPARARAPPRSLRLTSPERSNHGHRHHQPGHR